MYIITDDKFCLIPLAFNEFCEDIGSLGNFKKYVTPIKIERFISKNTIKGLMEYFIKDLNKLYIIDMQNIVSYENRAFNIFLSYPNIKVIIININNKLLDNIKEDLKGRYGETPDNVLYSLECLETIYNTLSEKITNVYKTELVSIVHHLIQTVREDEIQSLKPLDSSGVYCNMYVNVKRLFADPDKYFFVIYHMVKMIVESGIKADALVSASRNGANIASILGWLLDKKVIHCTSLGPKFSLASGTVSKEIRKNMRYIYIFDFLCLGTEIKILNALLGIKGASLVAGFGIANYRSLENAFGESVLSKVSCLVDVQKENFGYQIAGTKEEIIHKLMKEDIDHGISRLRRI